MLSDSPNTLGHRGRKEEISHQHFLLLQLLGWFITAEFCGIPWLWTILQASSPFDKPHLVQTEGTTFVYKWRHGRIWRLLYDDVVLSSSSIRYDVFLFSFVGESQLKRSTFFKIHTEIWSCGLFWLIPNHKSMKCFPICHWKGACVPSDASTNVLVKAAYLIWRLPRHK